MLPRLVGKRSILAGLAFISLGVVCKAQPPAITPQTVADLHADRWTVRRGAFEHLAAVKDGIDNPRMQNLLIQLREKENVESNKGDPDLFEDDDLGNHPKAAIDYHLKTGHREAA